MLLSLFSGLYSPDVLHHLWSYKLFFLLFPWCSLSSKVRACWRSPIYILYIMLSFGSPHPLLFTAGGSLSNDVWTMCKSMSISEYHWDHSVCCQSCLVLACLWAIQPLVPSQWMTFVLTVVGYCVAYSALACALFLKFLWDWFKYCHWGMWTQEIIHLCELCELT